ncbi:glycoside hydrolase family 15 protein, partial [Pseudonocardia aurantiaca]
MSEAAIADHGLIGDLQTAALVSTDGSVDWFCCPRFDSPSVFGALLDDERGGHLRVRPARRAYETKQMYIPDTAILVTRFSTEAGAGEVVDFMPPTGREATGNHRLVRMLRCVRGTMTFDVDIAPRFDYGRKAHRTELTENGAVFSTDALTLTLHAVREPDDARLARVRVDENDVHLSIDLTAGDVRGLVLESEADGPPREIRVAEFQRLFDDTVAFWRSWLSRSTYTGRWRETLQRSAITLKLMTYAPTGGLVAAPTTGLPEQVGGERNWDYRYTWVRDASFSVYALLRLGFTEEAAQFSGWLRDRVAERVGGEGGPLNIMYRVDGSSDLKEESLGHWSGYRGSRPVRVGNGAADQLQLDIYGEAADSIFFADARGLQVGHRGWSAIRELLDWLAAHWDQPEEGIWETRGGRQDFTYGRLMCWVAFDRGIRMAAARGRPAAVETWTAARDAIYEQIMEKGWDAERGAFVQHYGSSVLDSSLLRMSSVGFISPYDPMWASTLRAMDAELV